MNNRTAVNFVNHLTEERDTPKSPQKVVTVIETSAKPRGLFLFNGVPVPRAETQEHSELMRRFNERRKLRTKLPTELHSPSQQSINADVTFKSLIALPRDFHATDDGDGNCRPASHHHYHSRRRLHATSSFQRPEEPPSSSSSRPHTREKTASNVLSSTTTTQESTVSTPFPLWSKYPHRFDTPHFEHVERQRDSQRKALCSSIQHIYHDDNFVAQPLQKEALFSRLLLPSHVEYEHLQRRQHQRGVQRSKSRFL